MRRTIAALRVWDDVPQLPECACGRRHGVLYRDTACDAATRRLAVVTRAALSTSDAIMLRRKREQTGEASM